MGSPTPAAAFVPESQAILWDVVAQHVEEAEYACESFDRALDSSTYRLESLARGPEHALETHLDALLVNGPAVVDRVLMPAALEPDAGAPHLVTAVGLALLGAGHGEALLPLLVHADPIVRAAAIRAGGLAADPATDRRVLAQLAGARASEPVGGLLGYVARRGLTPVQPLGTWVTDSDTDTAVAVAEIATENDARTHRVQFESLLTHPDPRVFEAILLPLLASGAPAAWAACTAAACGQRPRPLPACLFAALGGPTDHVRLAAGLDNPGARATVLFALAFSGDAQQIPVLMRHLSDNDPTIRRLAAQAIAAIAGLDLEDESLVVAAPAVQPDTTPDDEVDAEAAAALPPLDEDDLDAELVPLPEAVLPEPNPDGFTAWWNEHGSRLDRGERLLGGQPWSPAAAVRFFEVAPLRLRHVVADSVRIRSGLQIRFDTRAFVRKQRLALRELGGVSPMLVQGRVGGW